MITLRRFDPALHGFIYLAIIVIVPICPVIISMIIGQLDTVFFVMLVAACISLLYDLYQSGIRSVCPRIAVENFIEIFMLIVSVVVSVIGLIIPQGLNDMNMAYTLGGISVACYSVAAITTLVEIIVCFVFEVKFNKAKLSNIDIKKDKKIAKAGVQV